MDSPGAIARPYARAAFGHARDNGALAEWSAALGAAAEATENRTLRAALESPGSLEPALGVLCEVVDGPAGGARRQVQNLLRLLHENRRLEALAEIARQFEHLRREDAQRVEAVMVSARPVEQARQDEIARALSQRLGRQVDFRLELDEGLLGGARIQVGDQVLDGSARAGLSKLATALGRPASQGLAQ